MSLCILPRATVQCWVDDCEPEVVIPVHHLVVEVSADHHDKVAAPPP